MQLSKQDTAQCCFGAACGYSKGCDAGTPSAAMRWAARSGVVTGGDFNSTQGCTPYALFPCNVDPTNKQNPLPICHEPKPPPTLTCATTCSNSNYATAYAKDKQGGAAGVVSALAYRGDNNTHMMAAIVAQGSVSVTFTVMQDFPAYRSGVYTHVNGSALGGHAVTAIGWGVDAGVPYWLIKNSWSTYWGESGFFRIRRGTDEVGIESTPTAIKYPSN